MLERHLSDLRKAVPQFTAFIKDHLHKITVFPDKSKLEMCQNQLETLEIQLVPYTATKVNFPISLNDAKTTVSELVKHLEQVLPEL